MELKKYLNNVFEDNDNKVVMFNPRTGKTRTAPAGISWTTAIFGPIPALFRGDFLGFTIMLIIDFLTSFNPFVSFVANILIALFYNYFFITHKVNNGYTKIPDASKELLKKHGYTLHILSFKDGGDNE